MSLTFFKVQFSVIKNKLSAAYFTCAGFFDTEKKTFYFLSNFLILHVNFACSLFSVSDIISLDNVDFNCRLFYYSFL